MLLPALEEGLRVTARLTLQNGKRGISTGTGKVATIAYRYHGSYDAHPGTLTVQDKADHYDEWYWFSRKNDSVFN